MLPASVLALVAAIVLPGLRTHGGLSLPLWLACVAALLAALAGEIGMRRYQLRSNVARPLRSILSTLLLALACYVRWRRVFDWRPQLLLPPIAFCLLALTLTRIRPRLPLAARSGRRPWRIPAVVLPAVVLPAWVLPAVALLLVPIWKATLREPDAVAGLLLLLACCLSLALAAEVGSALARVAPPVRTNLRVLLVTSSLLLFGLESGLRLWTTRYSSYVERNGLGPYRSPYRKHWGGRLHVYAGDTGVFELPKSEFTHSRRISSLGLTDGELPRDKTPGEYRILALGDSFTEGVGTSADGSWPKVLERELAGRLPRSRVVTAFNAGVSGSDPVFEYALFEEKLLPFRPDLVVIATNSSDIQDVMSRGGMERFRPDGTVAFREPPRWEWLYARSYVSRMIVQEVLRRDWLLLAPAERSALQLAAAGELRAVILACRALCRQRGAELVVVAHPLEHELKAGRYEFDFDTLVRALRGDPELPVIDLLEQYRRGPITAANSRQFYWPIDLHHNTRGYAVMGGLIAGELLERGLLQ